MHPGYPKTPHRHIKPDGKRMTERECRAWVKRADEMGLKGFYVAKREVGPWQKV